MPFLLKDYGAAEAGEPHHQGMRVAKDAGWRAPADSAVTEAFRAAGLVTVGRTNVPELALMGTTEPDAYGPTRNPWDLDRSPGGSSGGSAAAVAAGLVPAAHANDIAGSIRIPAAQCGLVGLKPTRGRVVIGRPSDPAVAMNTEGVVTRTVRDAAGLLDAVTDAAIGPWPAPPLPGPLAAEVGVDPGRLRVGVCVEAFNGAEVDEGCAAAAMATATLLERLGHHVEQSWPRAAFEPDLLPDARTLLAVHAAADVAAWSAALGRELGEGDVEPITWQSVVVGRAVSGAELLALLGRQQERARAITAWWRRTAAGDGLRPPRHADHGRARSSARPLQAGLQPRPGQRLHAGVQRHRAARPLAAAGLARRRAAARRAAGGGLRPRGRAGPGGRPARAGRTVGRPPPSRARLSSGTPRSPRLRRRSLPAHRRRRGATQYGPRMIVAVVRFPLDPPLSMVDAAALFEASAPSYQQVPGLLRKHYLVAPDGSAGGGVYLWESREAAEALYDEAWRDAPGEPVRIASRHRVLREPGDRRPRHDHHGVRHDGLASGGRLAAASGLSWRSASCRSRPGRGCPRRGAGRRP